MTQSLSRRDLARRFFVGSPRPAPAAISNERHVLSRATFGPTPADEAEILQLGVTAWLDRQLAPDSIDDSAFEAALPAIVQPYLNTAADIRLLARAIRSKRQLAWRMVHFLNNHFSTNRGSTQGISETAEDDAFRKVCFTTFATALRHSATSPAMIDFLDSDTNIAASPNENYARELMELHTLGVGGGYTEPDVAEAARVFTGWSRVNNRPGGPGTPVLSSTFRFYPGRHDSASKATSFGWSTPGIAGAYGYLEGYALLDFLAAHASTARFFVAKLCRYFVADQPVPRLLHNVERTFVRTGGDLRATVRAIFTDPDFAHPSHLRSKVMDGFELVANFVRRLEMQPTSFSQLNTRVGLLRTQPHQNPVPTGYPEIGPAWQGAGNVLPRWKFADELAQDTVSGSSVPWATLFPAGYPGNGAGWVDALIARLVDDDVPPTTRYALTVFMDGRLSTLPASPTLAQLRPHVRDLLSLVLRLPEAQLQ
jgi:uncharacterized protein (DUF1800 family)